MGQNVSPQEHQLRPFWLNALSAEGRHTWQSWLTLGVQGAGEGLSSDSADQGVTTHASPPPLSSAELRTRNG